MDCKTCTKCGARWMEGQHFWNTGKPGNELDLAGLVCNNLDSNGSSQCINPKKGQDGGDTWEKRYEFLQKLTNEMDRGKE